MNKEQQELVDDAYKNYCKYFENLDPMEKLSSGTILIGSLEPYIPFTKEEFIDRIKNYPEFSKKWGYNISHPMC